MYIQLTREHYYTVILYIWGPGGRDDKGKSAFPPTHCAEIGVVGLSPTHS